MNLKVIYDDSIAETDVDPGAISIQLRQEVEEGMSQLVQDWLSIEVGAEPQWDRNSLNIIACSSLVSRGVVLTTAHLELLKSSLENVTLSSRYAISNLNSSNDARIIHLMKATGFSTWGDPDDDVWDEDVEE